MTRRARARANSHLKAPVLIDCGRFTSRARRHTAVTWASFLAGQDLFLPPELNGFFRNSCGTRDQVDRLHNISSRVFRFSPQYSSNRTLQSSKQSNHHLALLYSRSVSRVSPISKLLITPHSYFQELLDSRHLAKNSMRSYITINPTR